MNTARSYNVAYGVVALIFMALALRFFALQVVWGSYYRQRSESNFIQEQRIPHSRGHIFDAKDQLLVDNRPSYDVYMTFALLPKGLPVLKKLLAPLRWPKQRLQEAYQRIQDAAQEGSHEPVILAKGLSFAVCNTLQDRILSQGIRGVLVRGGELYVYPLQFPNQQAVWTQLQSFLELSQQQLDNLVRSAKRRAGEFARFKPSLLLADVGFEAQARIQSAISLGTLAGVSVVNAHKRRYIHGDLASHVLGFVNEVSLQEVRESAGGYFVGHKVGRQGIEKSYERVLRGEDGIRRIVVDARGRRLEESRQKALLGDARVVKSPVAGLDIRLSIDAALQRHVQETFVGKAGAVVALDPNTGYVLALASFPGYNSNHVVSRNNGAVLQKLAADPFKPWINRSIQSHYPPASVFKPVVALAALGESVVTPRSTHWCGGEFRIARTNWRCVRRYGHGWVDLYTALRSSCDVYFYQLGRELGTDKLAKGARQLGFGSLVGIDLPGEVAGFIPTCDYYRRRKGYCAPGFAVNSAIGQGDVTVTALQLAVAYAALANGGIVYRPQIVRTVSQAGLTQKEYAPQAVAYIDAKPEDLTVVRQALSAVLQRGGTAYGLRWNSDWPQLAQWLRKSTLSIGSKTGTGQVVRLGSKRPATVEEVPYLQRDHAWFVGFAPSHRPEIVVVVLVEHGGWGSKAAAPIGCDVIRAWSQGREEQDAG
ncbi:MAG: penicillin-binding protein 2 [Myxococcota bacterium]